MEIWLYGMKFFLDVRHFLVYCVFAGCTGEIFQILLFFLYVGGKCMFENLVENHTGKGTVVSGIIVSETSKKEGDTPEGRRFLEIYQARVASGKAFAAAGATLREMKSQETLAFWGAYAILSVGFGGTESYKAPPYDEESLRERLKALGWKQKRLPSAFAAYCRKHKITMTAFQAACVLQEDASRKALRRDDDIVLHFPDSVMDYFANLLSRDDAPPLDKTMIALSKTIRDRLVKDGAK